MNIGNRIEKRLREFGWQQVDLLQRIPDLRAGTLSAIIQRDSVRTVYSEAIAEALGVTHSWLVTGRSPKERASPDDNVEHLARQPARAIPVIDWVQAGQMSEMTSPYSPTTPDGVEWVGDDFGPRAIALRIRGNSMEPEFHEGDRIIVDPEVRAQPGDFVVAGNNHHEATFKKYRPRGIDEQGREVFELVPLNDDYPVLRSDREPLVLLGTMIEHRRRRRR